MDWDFCKECGHEICYDKRENVWYHNKEDLTNLHCAVGWPNNMCGCKKAVVMK